MPAPGQHRRNPPSRCGQGGFQGTVNRPRIGPVFRSARFYGRFTITDTTIDSTGAPLAGATVRLFDAGTDVKIAETVSDGSGNYTFSIGNNAGNFYVTAHKDGGTPVAGISARTLVAVAQP